MNGAAVFALFVFVESACVACGEVIDYSVDPRPTDNFLEASFRFVIPDESVQPSAVLVFIPGTDGDGRGVVANPTFLSIASACHAALIGCKFRGEGLAYDDPSGGSGRALDEAISHFASTTHNQLTQAPLLLIGYSQGGMFTFNYICWHPERVKAFAALKAVLPKFQPQAASFSVPGLLAAGQRDEPARIRAIANAFLSAAGKHSRWAFLFEEGSGHELDAKSIGLAGALFEGICAEAVPEGPILSSAETKTPESDDSTASSVCWFPDQAMAKTWASIHKEASLESLALLPDRPRLQEYLSVESEPADYKCKNGTHCEGVLELTASEPGVSIDRVGISGDSFILKEPSHGTLPLRIPVCFAPHGLPWGRIRADIDIDGSLNGQTLQPYTLSIVGIIQGPISAVPATLYLGVVSRGSAIDEKIQLKCDHGLVHLVESKAPTDMTLTVGTSGDGASQLNIHWSPGKRLGNFVGEILLTFDEPEHGQLRIPVVGVVSR